MRDGVNRCWHALASSLTKGVDADAGGRFLVMDNASWYLYLPWTIGFPGLPTDCEFPGKFLVP